jgi:menaquinone-dependent protoporphyrinogen IX oxidase
VDIINLGTLKERRWPSITDYDGVIIASSIKGSFWRNEPKKFLKKKGSKILENNKILGIFVSSAFSLLDKKKAKERYIKKILKIFNLKPHIYDIFGPVFDFSDNSKLSVLEKKLLKLTVKTIIKEKGLKIDNNGRNDFRDWQRIDKFANNFSDFLNRTKI